MTIAPARRIRGRLRVPGDKSISHRYALVAALAERPSQLTGYAAGADCRSTLSCLQALAVEAQAGADTITILGRGLGGFSPPGPPLDAGNSGTTDCRIKEIALQAVKLAGLFCVWGNRLAPPPCQRIPARGIPGLL